MTTPAQQAPAQAQPTAAGPQPGVGPATTAVPTASEPSAEAGEAGEAERAGTDGQAAEASQPNEVPTPAQGADSATDTSPGHAPSQGPAAEAPAPTVGPLQYRLERVEILGASTRLSVIEGFVTLRSGDVFDVEDPEVEDIRWRLVGTGWFDEVKLSLKRGSRRGWVVLVIEVVERNTLVITRVVAGLSRVVPSSGSLTDELRPYGGLDVLESNLLGLGIGVGASVVGSQHQFGLDLRYDDGHFLASDFSLRGRAFYNAAREFYGRQPMVAITCQKEDVEPGEEPKPCDPDVLGKRAVVIYKRYGLGLGTGHNISSSLRYTLDWLGEVVDVSNLPTAASTLRGEEVTPIDFKIDAGTSHVSSVQLGLVYDRRDDPALPGNGQLVSFDARVGTGLIGSSYDFVRFSASAQHWQPLPWGHVLRLGVFAGTVVGRAPFFYHFYAADLNDLLPSRVRELNIESRRTHNLLDTSIVEMDMEELAGRVDLEYGLPLHRGRGVLRRIHAYFGVGLFALTRREDLRVAIQGYEGVSRIPVDLTFDFGIEADTTLGLFKLGLSSLSGFLPSSFGREAL